MRSLLQGFLVVVFVIALHYPGLRAEEIERFEHYTTDQGLSQNTITSIHCDSKGFMWFGTYNGLNRFDGYHFKIFQNTVNNPGIFTNNRVISIWEDQQQFLWFETYDGYYHYYNQVKETFSTLPKYLLSAEEKYSRMNCFHQHSPSEIWLGSSNSGVYRLSYDAVNHTYNSEQFLSRGQYAISNNNIRFIISDRDSSIYIGAKNGLNMLGNEHIRSKTYYFQHFFSDMRFTCSVALNNEVWMGTENSGLVVYNLDTKSFYVFDKENSPLTCNHIDVMKVTSQGNIIIGSSTLFIYQPIQKRWLTVPYDGERIDKIFEDHTGMLWVITGKFGVQQVNQHNGKSKHFDLSPANYKFLSDRQRPYFYEDSNNNLWICLHGAGLASYNREKDDFYFFRNNPNDPKSISSNTVMCMTEDQNGTLWIGAGLEGGINKVIFKNPAFTSIQYNKNFDDYTENIVRALCEDSNGRLWVASKGGSLKLYDQQLNELKPAIRFPFEPIHGLVYNLYTIFQDSRGYIWLGSKGAGIAVSTQPVNRSTTDYSRIAFHRYQKQEGDSVSLCNNNIYSIKEDAMGRIWIGTYGGGLSLTQADNVANLHFTNFNTGNSALSNDMVRYLMFDSGNNLWVATTFGLNHLNAHNIAANNFVFESLYHDPDNANSLSYNDVVHIFEDSKKNLWFGTFGGGVNLMTSENLFLHFSSVNGLCNNEIFGITEDNEGYLWFSTGNGLSRFDPHKQSFDNFNKSNSLSTNSFSENTCLKLEDGRLVFGNINGFEVVQPGKIRLKSFTSHVTFTNFQLFNTNIDVNTEGTPLKQSIVSTERIDLKYNQSSFSVEFSAMNFLDESKTQYAYFLENFDNNWNYVGTQRKASYTNLKPGHYILRVKAALWNGNWDNDETVLHIKIAPPWWQTNYAYIIYLIVFITAIFMVSRGVIRVNSYRNELKVEKAVNEVKLQFFTNISHEIRTPLTLILGPIEDVLNDRRFPDEFRSTLLLMQKNGKRMLHLLNQLLDFRKVQNKKMILKVSKVNLVEFTRNIFDNFTPLAHHRQIKFNFRVNAIPEDVWIDPHRMDSVIFNILSNAFKFTPEGKAITVSIDQHQKLNEVYVRVSDSGPGIKSKDIPLVFNRYSILSGESGSTNGTGIGLNLSNELVKMHGGEIRVESLPEKGCTFTIVLKTGTAHLADQPNIMLGKLQSDESTFNHRYSEIEDQMLPYVSDELIKKLPGDKKTILVVEDHDQILNYVSETLSADYSILKARDGEQGLAMAAGYNPDLIVSDIMMPVMDGIEMTRRLKENFDTCHIPVILLTAKSGIDDQIMGIESGAEAYVLKPFNMALLRSMIFNLLEQRRLIMKKFATGSAIEVADLKINSRNKEFIDRIIHYIEENYNNPELSISQLVEISSVSRTVFYNKVKSLTGLSPIELMRQVKMKIAAQMLLNGYNVNEAAYQIGFNDSRYFSKQFKELFGEAPSQYKKKNASEETVLN